MGRCVGRGLRRVNESSSGSLDGSMVLMGVLTGL
jgi:hypothetical protein